MRKMPKKGKDKGKKREGGFEEWVKDRYLLRPKRRK